MRSILVITTISVGLISNVAWTAFLVFELSRFLASFF